MLHSFELLNMLSKDQVKHISNLARIGLTEKEAEELQTSLSSILDYVKKLDKVDVSTVQAIANITGLENTFREDRVNPDVMRSVHPDPHIVKDMAPANEGGYVKVKQILNKG